MKVISEARIPVKVWAPELEGKARDQAINLANLPFAMCHVALMPDAHAGYGMPIGGVLFADKAVVPYAIGVDIGCGVALVETDLTVEDLASGRLDLVLEQIASWVPTGFNTLDAPVDRAEAEVALGVERPESVQESWFEKALWQLGTLGGGNHFLEVQRDVEGNVYVMLHSGSRALGKVICDTFHKRALAQNDRWYSQLPDKELAFLPVGTPEYEGYWEAMTFALRFAEVNRARMLEATQRAFWAHTPIGRFEVLVDIHHNYAAWESHRGRNGIVHRKGAVRARAGEKVLIPGSMATASYLAEGLGNAESFETCQHGAGRTMSRTKARHAKTSAEVYAEMATLGVALHCSAPETVAEEAGFAYMEIETVMAASADLIRPITRLTPLGVVKG